MTRNRIFSATALVAAVAFAAGGGLEAQQPTTPPTTQPDAMQQTETLWGTAETRGFQEWGRGMQAAGFQERLGDRPHTAFVADDAAYQQVPATQRQQWQTDPAAQRAALGHTLIEGRVTMADLRQRDHVTTIDGQRIPVRVEGDRVWLGDAEVRQGDIAAGTGMIHQVDRVTWPQQAGQQQPGVQQPAQQQPGMQPQPGQQQPVREPVRKGGYAPAGAGVGVHNNDNNDG